MLEAAHCLNWTSCLAEEKTFDRSVSDQHGVKSDLHSHIHMLIWDNMAFFSHTETMCGSESETAQNEL